MGKSLFAFSFCLLVSIAETRRDNYRHNCVRCKRKQDCSFSVLLITTARASGAHSLCLPLLVSCEFQQVLARDKFFFFTRKQLDMQVISR